MEKAFSTNPIKIKEFHAVQIDFIDWVDDDGDNDNSDFLVIIIGFVLLKLSNTIGIIVK